MEEPVLFGLGDSWKAWGKATFLKMRQMVTSLVHNKRKLDEQQQLVRQTKSNG